jgi:hypothetical protein
VPGGNSSPYIKQLWPSRYPLPGSEIVVEFYGFARKFGFCRFHWLTLAAIIPSVSGRELF